LTRLGKACRVEETARRCAEFGKDLSGVIGKADEEIGQSEKTTGVCCHGF